MIKKNTIVLIIFQFVNFIVNTQAQVNTDPVVISFGNTEISRTQFGQQFEMSMIMNALESGIPIKSQDQVYILKQRFLEQYAKEMVLMDIAKQQGIKLSEEELDGLINVYIQDSGFSKYGEKNLRSFGFEDEELLREVLSRKEIISILVSNIKKDLEINHDNSDINAVLKDYYNQDMIRIYSQNIGSPSLE